jgi:hypothetical protein
MPQLLRKASPPKRAAHVRAIPLRAPLTLRILAAFTVLAWTLHAAEPQEKAATPAPLSAPVAPGMTVKLTRDVPLRFLDKTLRAGHEGETFRVLEVRAASLQVFLGVEQAGRLIAVWVPADAVAVDKKAATPREIEIGDDLFANRVPVLKIRISNEGLEKLRKDPRAYVEATLEEKGGPTLERVGVKLKGSVGSFKPIDERPGFSINTTKFKGKDRFHGLAKFQLNNGNQDGTFLNELLSGRIARKAGIPASRCTHAIVTLNDRFLGAYVLKEGFRDELIGSFFARTDGHLYDGGFCADIRKEMEVDRGDEGHHERLDELVQAISESNPTLQTAKVEKLVDVESYLRHLALETILCHWDGYSFNRNNYRMYENPDTGRFHFFLHGMDQTFGDPNWSLWRAPQASVGSILWRKPEVRARYDVVAREICENILFPGEWPEKAMQMGARLKTALAAVNPEAAKAYEGLIPQARDRIRARMESLKKQLKSGNPFKKFETETVIALGPFEWVAQAENSQADSVQFENRQCLRVKASGEAKGSWRLPVFLPKGVYRFDAFLRASGVEKIEDPSGEGVGLRISGASRQGKNAFSGELPWTKVSFEFESNGAEQTLVAELRAKSGELWIDRNSLRLNKLR